MRGTICLAVLLVAGLAGALGREAGTPDDGAERQGPPRTALAR